MLEVQGDPESEITAPPRAEPEPEVIASAPPPSPTPRKKIRPQASEHSEIKREIVKASEAEIKDYIESMAGGAPIKVRIARIKPLVADNGANIGGTLEMVDEAIDEDYIREMWGGGTFQLQVQKLGNDGRYKIFHTFQVKLAGEPKMSGRDLPSSKDRTTAFDPSSNLVETAFATMRDRERETQERMHRMERDFLHRGQQQGFDSTALAQLINPYVEQIRDLQATVRDLMTKEPPKDPVRDQLLTKMLDSEQSAVVAICTQYESRLEAQKERYEGQVEKMRERYEDRIDRLVDDHAKEKTRLEERHKDDLRAMEKRHEREIASIDKQHTAMTETTKVANEQRVDNKDELVKRLQRDLDAAAAKIATLEAKKDQTITEKADELLKVQEAIETLGGGGSDKDEKWYEKIINGLGNSEAAIALINRISGGPPPEQQQQPPPQQIIVQQPTLPPPGVPFQGADGNIYVRDAAGNVGMIDEEAARRMAAKARKRKKQKAHPNGAPASPPQQAADGPDPDDALEGLDDDVPVGRPPDAVELAAAIAFLENAIKGGKSDPEAFARGAVNLIPTDVLTYLMSFEKVDDFLGKIKLTAGSPLTTIAGRQFARQVHQYLRTGSAA